MIAVLKFSCALALLADVTVDVLDGPAMTGELKTLDEDSLTVVVEGVDVTRPVEDILKVTFATSAAATQDPLQVILHDGSQLVASQIVATTDEVTTTAASIAEMAIPRELVRGLLLQPLENAQQPQWSAFLKRENERDLLIVRKRNGPGLDFLTGIVSSVGESSVPFLLDGTEIPVPRERIVGIVFPQPDDSSSRAEGARIQLTDGTTLFGSDVFVEDGLVSFETGWGEFLEVELPRVSAVDYSAGRFHYLSDLPVLKETYFGLQPEGDDWGDQFEADRATRQGLSSPWRMSRDRFPNTGRPPLTLRGQRYVKGLCIFPSARIDFALDGRYSTLQAIVGVDDDVAFNQRKGRPVTAVELRIEADGETISRQLIKALDDPLRLNVNVTAANTLSLIVDFGDGSSVCDYLDLADARLIVDKSAKN